MYYLAYHRTSAFVTLLSNQFSFARCHLLELIWNYIMVLERENGKILTTGPSRKYIDKTLIVGTDGKLHIDILTDDSIMEWRERQSYKYMLLLDHLSLICECIWSVPTSVIVLLYNTSIVSFYS